MTGLIRLILRKNLFSVRYCNIYIYYICNIYVEFYSGLLGCSELTLGYLSQDVEFIYRLYVCFPFGVMPGDLGDLPERRYVFRFEKMLGKAVIMGNPGIISRQVTFPTSKSIFTDWSLMWFPVVRPRYGEVQRKSASTSSTCCSSIQIVIDNWMF